MPFVWEPLRAYIETLTRIKFYQKPINSAPKRITLREDSRLWWFDNHEIERNCDASGTSWGDTLIIESRSYRRGWTSHHNPHDHWLWRPNGHLINNDIFFVSREPTGTRLTTRDLSYNLTSLVTLLSVPEVKYPADTSKDYMNEADRLPQRLDYLSTVISMRALENQTWARRTMTQITEAFDASTQERPGDWQSKLWLNYRELIITPEKRGD